ncbi:MAG: PIN domain-containing protein [Prevotella sp.]|nr:PIN domain-containing protein [Prevotella sp.]
MRVFLDTNVIVDLYSQRDVHFLPASLIFDLAVRKEIELVVSATTFVNAFFLLKSYYAPEDLYETMEGLASKCIISSVDGDNVREALKMRAKDFEDSVQLLSSYSIPADVIVTRDKHFKQYGGNIMSPTEFLEQYHFFTNPNY